MAYGGFIMDAAAELGTDPMAYGGFIMDAAAELGRNPVSKHQIQPEYGDEQADAGRDG